MRNEDNNNNNNDNNKFKEETGKINSPNNGCLHVKSFVSGTDGPKLLGVKNHPHEISGTYDPCQTKLILKYIGHRWSLSGEKITPKYLGHRWSHSSEKSSLNILAQMVPLGRKKSSPNNLDTKGPIWSKSHLRVLGTDGPTREEKIVPE